MMNNVVGLEILFLDMFHIPSGTINSGDAVGKKTDWNEDPFCDYRNILGYFF